MNEKTPKKETVQVVHDHVNDFYSTNGLTINNKGVFFRKGSEDKEIYTKNVAGTSFQDNRGHRILCIAAFAASIILLIIIYKSSLIPESTLRIVLAVLLILTCIVTAVSFFLMRDEVQIYSTSNLLCIKHKLGAKENLSEIQTAIDKAVEDSKK